MLLVLIVVVSMFGFVSSGSCDDNQTIMRLYQENNSHVSFWNESVDTYLEEICYDEIFGSNYSGVNPHECTGTNRVLSLYNIYNSHASTVTDVNYAEEVCYGNLSCEYETEFVWSDTCVNGGEVVARMYSEANSHVSTSSDSNYLIKICCLNLYVGLVPEDISDIYWADANGFKITDEVNIGDTIKLVAEGVSSGDFFILEEDLVFDDDIKTITGEVVDGNLVGKWTITQSDLDKTEDFDYFYFNVDEGSDESGRISISGRYDDEDMELTVISPKCGDDFDESEEAIINISAFDGDDTINGNLRINGEFFKNFSNGEFSFNYNLNLPGSYQIVINATNDRGMKARHIANIMVLDKNGDDYVDGTYVAACIDEPKDFSSLEGSSVTFDARTTRAINVSDGIVSRMAPGNSTNIDKRFSWYWRFDMLGAGLIDRNYIKSEDPLAYYFAVNFPVSGDNSAYLRVEFE